MDEHQPPGPCQGLVAKARQGAEERTSLHEWHRLRIGAALGTRWQQCRYLRQLERGVVRGDELLERLQRGPRLDAELVGERGSRALEGRQRLSPGGPARY